MPGMYDLVSWAWVPITIWAALCQTVRTGLQKSLKGRLSTNGASFTRFLYGMPLAAAYMLGIAHWQGLPLPALHGEFLLWLVFGATAQILATNLLILALTLRNFMVGTAYSKTEAIQAAVFGLVLLGEPVTIGGLAAIIAGTVGVMLMSLKDAGNKWRAFLLGWSERPALIGIASGSLFAISAVGFRAASLSLDTPSLPVAAAVAVACATVFQTGVMAIYLRWREPGEIGRVLRHWRAGSLVGLTSAAGSVGWFTAMALQVAAYVRMLGMIEMAFTFITAVLIFHERPSRAETAGAALLLAGILFGLAMKL